MEMQAVDHDPFVVPTQAVDHDPFAPGFEAVDHDPFESQFGRPAAMVMPPPAMSTPPEWAQGIVRSLISPVTEAGAYLGSVMGGQTPLHPAEAMQEAVKLGSAFAGPKVGAGTLAAMALPMAKVAAKLAPEAEQAAAQGIRAYHGSPHDFDAFDLSKIGTGEGAQAYGHGLYFAENPAVSEQYRRGLSNATVGGVPFDRNNPIHVASDLVHEMGRDAALAELKARIQRDPGDFFDQSVRYLESGRPLPEFKTSGRMYEVNINAHPDQFLDWDKPLSEHPAGIQSKLPEFSPHMTGAQINESARLVPGEYRNNAVARENLAARGIPGIKYLDQGSRVNPDKVAAMDRMAQIWRDDAKRFPDDIQLREKLTQAESELERMRNPAQTSNYVVFDPKLIDIIKKYGIAGLGAFPIGSRFLEPVDHNPFAETQ